MKSFSYQRTYILAAPCKPRIENGIENQREGGYESLPVKGRSKEALTWTCSACGAENDASLRLCDECGGDRAGDPAIPKRPESDTFEDKVVLPKPSPKPEDTEWEGKGAEKADEAVEAEEDDEEEEEAVETGGGDEEEEGEQKAEPQPPTIISSPLSSIETILPPAPEPTFQPTTEPAFQPTPAPTFQPSPEPASPPTGPERYYLVFVNTPAQSLIKSKVPIELDIFPVVSIGRSPENVIVIPDQEVSRVHAELTTEGARLLLKDLKSKNGTYVYDGKKFQQVTDSVEVKPNSILKFGTGTIVRLVSE